MREWSEVKKKDEMNKIAIIMVVSKKNRRNIVNKTERTIQRAENRCGNYVGRKKKTYNQENRLKY